VDVAEEEDKNMSKEGQPTHSENKAASVSGTELFPMFSIDPTDADDSKSTDGLVKVSLVPNSSSDSLVEDAFEKAIHEQHRPNSYYFTKLDDDTLNKIQVCAVSGDSIIQNFQKFSANHKVSKYKLINLASYNKRVEKELAIEKLKLKKKQNSRPGKKKRLAKIKAKAMRAKLKDEALELRKKQAAKFAFRNRRITARRTHNMFNKPSSTGNRIRKPRKRGGRKHKKSANTQQVHFRTE